MCNLIMYREHKPVQKPSKKSVTNTRFWISQCAQKSAAFGRIIFCVYWTPLVCKRWCSLSFFWSQKNELMIFRPKAALFCAHWEIQNLVFMTFFFSGFSSGICFSTSKELFATTMRTIHPYRANLPICIWQSVKFAFLSIRLKCFVAFLEIFTEPFTEHFT